MKIHMIDHTVYTWMNKRLLAHGSPQRLLRAWTWARSVFRQSQLTDLTDTTGWKMWSEPDMKAMIYEIKIIIKRHWFTYEGRSESFYVFFGSGLFRGRINMRQKLKDWKFSCASLCVNSFVVLWINQAQENDFWHTFGHPKHKNSVWSKTMLQ